MTDREQDESDAQYLAELYRDSEDQMSTFDLTLPADLPGDWQPFGDHPEDIGKGAGWTWRIDDFSITLAPRPAKSEWVLYASAPDFRCDHEDEPLSIRINATGLSVRDALNGMWGRTIYDDRYGSDWSAFRHAFDAIRVWLDGEVSPVVPFPTKAPIHYAALGGFDDYITTCGIHALSNDVTVQDDQITCPACRAALCRFLESERTHLSEWANRITRRIAKLKVPGGSLI